MNRRNFIGTTASLIASLFLKPNLTFASGNAGNGKRIIALNLIGGWDGHGSIAYGTNPNGDLFRSTLRPDLYPKLNDLMLLSGEQVGLHSAFRDLHETEANGKIKLILNTGIMQGRGTASHSSSQKIWEKGDYVLTKDGSVGWIGRSMDEFGLKTGQVFGIGTGSKLSFNRNESDGESIIVSESLATYLKKPIEFGEFTIHDCDSTVHSCDDLKSTWGDDNLYKEEVRDQLKALRTKTGVIKKYEESSKLADNNISLVQSMSGVEVTGNYLQEGLTAPTRFGRHCMDTARIIKFSKTNENLLSLIHI